MGGIVQQGVRRVNRQEQQAGAGVSRRKNVALAEDVRPQLMPALCHGDSRF